MTTLYFVRHGEALGNARKTWQGGGTDHPLTEKGMGQGALLAARFDGVALDAIFTSPLIRARQTAGLIAARHPGVPVEVTSDLMEISAGDMEDLPFERAQEIFPEAMAAWHHAHPTFVGPGAGDGGVPAAWDRIRRLIGELVRRYPDGTVLLAAHGGILRLFNLYAQGLPLERVDEMGWGDNTCVSCVRYDAKGRPEPMFFNDTAHVSPELMTKDVWWEDEWKEII